MPVVDQSEQQAVPVAQEVREVMPGHWSTPGGLAMALATLDDPHMARNRERISDFALANEVYLSPGIANLTDAKERIRWLSASLAVALLPASLPCKSGEGAGEIDQLAQFLHDEGGFGDAMTDRTWPEHDGDTGQRGDGWVKIVPSDVVAKFRDVARRWLLPRAALTPDATQTREAELVAAIGQALQCTPHIATDNSGGSEPYIFYDCGDPWEILRAALSARGGA